LKKLERKILKLMKECKSILSLRPQKIKIDFVERAEKAMISLEEGNLARIEQGPIANENDKVSNEKRHKICTTCVYAKVTIVNNT